MDEGRYVIFIGSPVLDNYFLLDRWPAQGDKMRVDYMGKLCGGMIGNAARNCASLGVRSCCFDVVDTDRDGELIMQAMRQDHVDTSHIIRRHHQDKLLSIVMVSGGERNVFLSGSRPRHELTLTPEQKSFFYHADYVYGELLFPWLIADDLAFLQDLKAHGVKLVFDLEVTMFADDWYERAACADIIFTNEFGADKFRGDEPLEAFAHRLFGEGVRKLVVTLGGKGCRVLTPQEDFTCPGYKVEVQDTTGAGDTFNSTFLACIIQGMDDRTAAAFANAAAAMAVMQYGPATGITTMEKIRHFMKTHRC